MEMPAPARLDHACFVVEDLDSTAQSLSRALGIGPWNVWTLEPAESKVHGVEQRFSFRMALCQVGEAAYELVSPVSGSSVYREHLDLRGNGLHHTCLVYDSIESVRVAKAGLVSQGRDLLQEASTDDLFDFAYFAFPEIGSAVELLFVDLAKMPAPEAVI
jgi:hypothetical protein